jgi:outer membrane protein OmpA-like peptidoglycan-associated protein
MAYEEKRVERWRPSGGVWWLLALPALMIASLFALQMLWSQQADRRAAAAPVAAAPAVEPAPEPVVEAAPAEPAPVAEAPVAEAPAEFVRNIGDVELRGAADGVESKLIGFIEAGTEPCTDPQCWFTFDRLTFKTGSAELDMEKSAAQIENIHRILGAFPTVQLKIGGYTDNTGTDEGNMALSQARADAVVAAVVALGSAPDRMDAEGYGAQHPVATNDTEEGRAQNRRIDVRVRQR